VEIACIAYGPADATAIPKPQHLLPHLNPDSFYLSLNLDDASHT